MIRKRNTSYFTSEAVSAGHPDKICDQISDAILDYCLAYDKNSRVAIECLVSERLLVIAGEVTTKAILTNEVINEIAKRKIQEIGYTDRELGFSTEDIEVGTFVHSQSPDIAMGVDKGGAGDQGIMFGGAVFETDNFMPVPIALATKIMDRYNYYIKNVGTSILKPDAKCQVTVKYTNNVPTAIRKIVVSANHSDIDDDVVKSTILNEILRPALQEFMDKNIDESLRDFRTSNFEVLINPTGRFVKGGPAADSGVTGRKIICDTYGGYFRHGGGAFSGKDPSKVDRTAAYMARYIAKNLVSTGLVDRCEIQLSYIIGEDEPCSIRIDSDKPEENEKLENIVKNLFDLTPNGMINELGLKDGIVKYSEVAQGCHFRNEAYPWEKVDKVDSIEELYDELSE
jgi:S-adenosylmethionine synthetase